MTGADLIRQADEILASRRRAPTLPPLPAKVCGECGAVERETRHGRECDLNSGIPTREGRGL